MRKFMVPSVTKTNNNRYAGLRIRILILITIVAMCILSTLRNAQSANGVQIDNTQSGYGVMIDGAQLGGS